MTEPVKTPDAARLDELAAVTKTYGRYSGPNSGFAVALTGAWLLACEWVLRAADRPGEVMYALAPVAWIALAVWARRYYQRHGEVVLPSADEVAGMRELSFVMIWVLAIYGVARQIGSERDAWQIAAIAAFVAVPMLALRLLRSRPQLTMAFVLTMYAAQLQGGAHHPVWYKGFRVGFAAFLVVFGVLDHLRYRRVERRLAALKGSP